MQTQRWPQGGENNEQALLAGLYCLPLEWAAGWATDDVSGLVQWAAYCVLHAACVGCVVAA